MLCLLYRVDRACCRCWKTERGSISTGCKLRLGRLVGDVIAAVVRWWMLSLAGGISPRRLGGSAAQEAGDVVEGVQSNPGLSRCLQQAWEMDVDAVRRPPGMRSQGKQTTSMFLFQ